jgi:hypothetical protein
MDEIESDNGREVRSRRRILLFLAYYPPHLDSFLCSKWIESENHQSRLASEQGTDAEKADCVSCVDGRATAFSSLCCSAAVSGRTFEGVFLRRGEGRNAFLDFSPTFPAAQQNTN